MSKHNFTVIDLKAILYYSKAILLSSDCEERMKILEKLFFLNCWIIYRYTSSVGASTDVEGTIKSKASLAGTNTSGWLLLN